jgi:hypothetical protein
MSVVVRGGGTGEFGEWIGRRDFTRMAGRNGKWE